MDVAIPAGITEPKFVALAREVAMGILPIEHTLKRLGLTQFDLEVIKQHPRFIALPEFYNLIHDRKESMAAKVEAMKLLKSLGGLGERDPASMLAPERFHLEIHIGEGKPQVIDITPGPHNLRAIDKAELADFTREVNDAELAG